MRFHQLPVGARFRLDDEVYIKTSPLVASHLESNRERLIRRSAQVMEEGADRQATPSATQNLDPLGVSAAITTYHKHCLDALQRIHAHLPPALAAELKTELDRAWSELLLRLDPSATESD